MTCPGRRAAVDWLVSVAPDPAACRRRWAHNPRAVVPLPAGRRWDVLITPDVLGRAALDVLVRLVGRPGPVLDGLGGARIGFFVPAGAAAHWVGTGLSTAGPGAWIGAPHPRRVAEGGVRWLVPPDGTGTLTDAALLELVLHEAVAQRRDEGDR
ncbi:hypothetical protein [Streptomyces sp. NPDC050560]|uniref:hypothetical protein n=1 Tax=Streptomyces sp. NPDC050560 TaxID=3365630 RepID=UPI00378FDA25